MLILFCNLKKEDAEIYSLVLCSEGILHEMSRDAAGWRLLTGEADRNMAFDMIEKYLAENMEFEDEKFVHAPQVAGRISSGLWGSAVIMISYMASDGNADAPAYGSSAFHILNGELFRVVTSLFLHKDIAHLAGNMAGLAVFAAGVCMFAGYGAGWLIIVLSGALGNAANAFIHQTGHISIGASTAVFGAMGALVSRRFSFDLKSDGRKVRAWLPVAAGFALLGFLGVGGKETDILAHLFGFLAGTAIGFFYFTLTKRTAADAWQPLFLSIVSGAVILSWVTAP